MKKLKLFILVSAISGVLFTSCEKILDDTSNATPSKLSELKVSDDFNWSTGNTIQLTITGLPTEVPVQSTLTISMTNGTTLFSEFHQMDQDLTLSITLPSSEKELVLKYGSLNQTVTILNNKADFSFIPAVSGN